MYRTAEVRVVTNGVPFMNNDECLYLLIFFVDLLT